MKRVKLKEQSQDPLSVPTKRKMGSRDLPNGHSCVQCRDRTKSEHREVGAKVKSPEGGILGMRGGRKAYDIQNMRPAGES